MLFLHDLAKPQKKLFRKSIPIYKDEVGKISKWVRRSQELNQANVWLLYLATAGKHFIPVTL